MAVAPHLWTVASRFKKPPTPPAAEPWRRGLRDPDIGQIELSGLHRAEPGSRELLVFVHGIGGCAWTRYADRVAAEASWLGLSCFRFNLRGCDRRGGDYYHAGLSADLGWALSSPELSPYEKVYLLGYSMGGHIALHYACQRADHVPDARLAAVAAVCSPLDLTRASVGIDRPLSWPYRRYVLRNLNEIYAAVAATRSVPVAPALAARFRTLREWDEAVVAPRWGFRGAEDYYLRASVAPHLPQLGAPALLVAAERDPLVAADAVRPAALAAGARLDVRWVRSAGHVGFPGDLDLGFGVRVGLEGQALGWLTAH